MSFLLDEEKTWIQRDFGLDRRLIKALSKMGYTYPTLVQSRCIPIALQGKDVLVRARTGSGKTVAFSLPLLHKLLTNKAAEPNAAPCIQGLILAPTKELCKQIERHVSELVYYCRDIVTICALVDDNATVQQHKLQARPDVVISTPARLVQQIKASGKNGVLDLNSVKTLVIDEADLVLSFGYAEDVHLITSKMPKIFQGLLMSATLSPELDKFKRVLLHNPAVLKLEEEAGSKGAIGELLQFYLPATESDKFLILYVFIKLGLLQGKGLIFVNDVNKCYKLKLFLQQFYVSAAVLNAEVPVNSRVHMMEEFNRGVFDYLIATDAIIDQGEDDEEDDDDEDEGEEGDEGDEGEGEDKMDDENDEDEDEEADDDDEDNDDDSNDDAQTDKKALGKRSRSEAASKSNKKLTEKELNDREIAKQRGKGKSKGAGGDGDYGVSRGIDFQGVNFVINFDFPKTASAYTHRIGRTARGGASGTALSFVSVAGASKRDEVVAVAERDAAVLHTVRSQQPRLGVVEGDNVLAAIGDVNDDGMPGMEADPESRMQPAPLNFNMQELESFRYRIEDTLRSVTAAAVKEFRTAEIKREILNSAKLKQHFAENPNDLKVLRHDKAILHPIVQKDHLRHVPEYLIPHSMRTVARTNTGKKKRRKGSAGPGGADKRIQQSKNKDPLMAAGTGSSSAAAPDNDGGDNDNDGEGDDSGNGDASSTQRVFTNSDLNRGLGRSGAMSGRQQWKMRHKKGKFNPKNAKKDENKVKGSFQREKRYK